MNIRANGQTIFFRKKNLIYLCLLCIFLIRKYSISLKINNINTKVNFKALRARHKKLKQNKFTKRNYWLSLLFGKKKIKLSSDQKKRSFNNVDLTKTFHLSTSRFATKVSLFSVVFLLISSLFPSYAFSSPYDHSYSAVDNPYEYETNNLVTLQEGFLTKPSIITEESDRSQYSETISYEVQFGDTLSEIASRFNLKVNTILNNNSISNPNKLRKGTILTILPVDGIVHTFKKGDTLAKIAKTYKVKTDVIIAQNKLSDKEPSVDQVLIVPGGKKVVPRYIASRGSSRSSANNYSGAGYGSISNVNYNGNISQTLIKPAAGKITQYYRRGHYAVDIGNRNRGPILAAANGVIIKAQGGYNGGYGNMIIVDHGNGRQTLYAHMQAIYSKVGDTVSQGQTMGWMGNTGRTYGATGIHLHFELRINGRKVNPLLYIK